MANIEWRTPAPRWAGAGPQAGQPFLAGFANDSFLADFLDLMEGRAPGKTPADLDDYAAAQLDAPGQPASLPLKLFLPAHGRYYLVAGSLVCRQLALPDRAVARAGGESTAFVVRRLLRNAQGQLMLDQQGRPIEQAWVDAGAGRGWHTLADAAQLHPEEERLPLHPVAACAAYQPGTSAFADAFGLSSCGVRTVYYGYVPVANRAKYAERVRPAVTLDPTAQFQSFVDDVLADEPGHDPRKDDVEERVYRPWLGLSVNPITGTSGSKPDKPPDTATRRTLSLYLLLDMLDIIQSSLPTVYAALGTDDGGSLGAGSKRRALFDALKAITGVRTASSGDVLTKVLDGLKPHLQLVQNKPGVAPVSDSTYNTLAAAYDLNGAGQGKTQLDALLAAFNEALDEEKSARTAAGQPWVPAPSAERLELLHDQVAPEPAGDDIFVLRLVYLHPPCRPVLSQPSARVTFAKFYDPDAPARHIRIELPSIKPRDLRSYKRGVGLEMSPELRKLMGRVHKGLLDGEDLAGGDSGITLGMICSFSLQIIFLVAFIVMFIFLIALNFIFWWLPFLKICFPIPKKK